MSKTILIAGATGMVGSQVLLLAVASDHVSKVIVYGRRSVGLQHAKLEEYLSPEFMKFPEELDLSKVDHILFCVGVYTGAVKRDVFREITVDYPVALAHAHTSANPSGLFTLLSGAGADRSEKSRMMFAEDKGAAENKLSSLYPDRFYTLRPGYIYPVEKRSEPNFSYRLSRKMYPLLKLLGPKYSITSHQLAEGIFNSVQNNPEQETLENNEILQYIQA
mgnify:FL=1